MGFVFQLRRLLAHAVRFFVLVWFAIVAVTPALAQQPGNGVPSEPPPIAASASGSTAAPTVQGIRMYPNTAKGLESLVRDMIKLQKDGNQQGLAQYAKSLALPDPGGWFKSVFGSDLGSQMMAIFSTTYSNVEVSVPNLISAEVGAKMKDVEAVRFDDSCNGQATAVEYPFLLLRQQSEPLYDVRFVGGSSEAVWSYFAYIDGGFRFIGNMRKAAIKPQQPAPDNATQRVRVGGNVVAGRRIYNVTPLYPTEAKAQGVQGTVILHGIIAKDGSIKSLDLNEGQCWLAKSAMEAVHHWRYQPYVVDGNPVEVETTINVVFSFR